MASFNKVVLLGNLTRDPELKKSPAGISVAKLRLAVNETYRDRQTGQPKEVACFVDVAVWDKQAESCGQYLTRGSQRFHGRMGFVKAGSFHRCACKFGRWYDMIWMEKLIGEHKEGL